MTATALTSMPATWFDGRTAAAWPVNVCLTGQSLVVSSDAGLLREVPLRSVRISDPSQHAPRFIYLGDGSTLEVPDPAPLGEALAAVGRPLNLVARLQQSATASTAMLALLVATLVFAYFEGVPAAARWLAFALPSSVEARLGEQFQKTLELRMLKPSELSPHRREDLQAMLRDAAVRGAPELHYRLEPRAARQGEVINAFTLPGGTVILLDGLVDFADNDDQILGVLGHEFGHIANKHVMRNLLQAVAIGAMASAAWGDFSGAAANVPVVFGALHYSRQFETEADYYAVQFLRKNGKDAKPLIEFFQEIMERNEPGEADSLEFLSTHPQTRERIERLKKM